MQLKELITVVCRNAGRYFKVANRSDFYKDFLRSLYDKQTYPAFYDNKIECLSYYAKLFSRTPEIDVDDECKTDHYIYYYDEAVDVIRSITIREVIMQMYNPENAFEYSLKSLQYTCTMFELFKDRIELSETVEIAMALNSLDYSNYSGDETIETITDPVLLRIILRAKGCK